MAASSSSAFNRVELSAVSCTPHQHVEFEWALKNFRALVLTAINRNDVIIASLPFDLKATLFPPGTPPVSMCWKLQVEGEALVLVKLWLTRKTFEEGGSLPPALPRTLFSRSWASIYKDFKNLESIVWGDSIEKLQNHSTSCDIQSHLLWDISFVFNKLLDSEGSLNLNLKVEADFYVDTDGIAEILSQVDHNNLPSEDESFKISKEILLDQVACLLGDEVTSDVIVVSLRNNDVQTDVEVESFYGHSSILSGRSAILREKLKDSNEKKDGKVVLKLEEDVAFEVIHHFLTFIYSGRLKDNRKDRLSAAPIWLVSLPELVQLAVKYKVYDLVDFCDLNLHRTALVYPAKTTEILCLANHLNLKRTLDKLQTAFSKDPELLFQSLNL